MSVPLSSPKERIVIFDIARILLITLVINLHIRIITAGEPNILTQYGLYGVPLFLMLSFFLMSKYFLKENLSKEDLFKRLKRLTIPLLIWSLIGFLPHLQLLSLPNVLLQLITGELVNVPLYYLNLLILFTILFWALTYVRLSYRMYLYIVLLVLALVIEYSHLNFLLFEPTSLVWRNSYGRFIELLPYSIFGILFGFIALHRKNPWVIYLTSFIVVTVGYILTRGISQPPGFRYAGHTLLFGSLAAFSIIILLIPFSIPRKLQETIHILGKYSFGVYLMHYPLLELLTNTSSSLAKTILSFPLLFLFLYTAFCYALCISINTLSKNRLSFLFT